VVANLLFFDPDLLYEPNDPNNGRVGQILASMLFLQGMIQESFFAANHRLFFPY
jgi:hypothetical protein